MKNKAVVFRSLVIFFLSVVAFNGSAFAYPTNQELRSAIDEVVSVVAQRCPGFGGDCLAALADDIHNEESAIIATEGNFRTIAKLTHDDDELRIVLGESARFPRGESEALPLGRHEAETSYDCDRALEAQLPAEQRACAYLNCLGMREVRRSLEERGGEGVEESDYAGVVAAYNAAASVLSGRGFKLASEVQSAAAEVELININAPRRPNYRCVLDPYKVYKYRDLSAEIDASNIRLSATEGGTLVVIQDGRLLNLGRDDIERGLRADQVRSAESLRDTLQGYYGVRPVESGPRLQSGGGFAPSATNCGDTKAVTYGAGRVTPANDLVVDYVGPRIEPVILENTSDHVATRSALQKMGYRVMRLDSTSLRSEYMCELARAQTVLMTAHAAVTSVEFGCFQDIPHGTRECCQATKDVALRLGLPGADRMNCEATPPPTSPPFLREEKGEVGFTFQINSLSSSTGDCFTAKAEDISRQNRCMIQLNIANNGLAFGKQQKAAVFTSQCDGGQCAVAGKSSNIMDLVTGSTKVNFSNVAQYDDRILAKDISGEAQYCKRSDRISSIEPFDGASCERPSSIIMPPGDPTQLRVVENSVSFRGAAYPTRAVRLCGTFLNSPAWNSSAFDQYCIANVGGSKKTQVEFYPSIGSVTFADREDLADEGIFNAQTTSELGQEISVDLDYDFEPYKRGLSDLVGRMSKSKTGVAFRYNLEKWPLFNRRTWSSWTPRMLEDFYGESKQSWPWYATVKLTGRAPNSIEMAGNSAAQFKDIWSAERWESGLDIWSTFYGKASDIGKPTEIKIPAAPGVSCCRPVLRIEGGRVSQNGCECQDGVGKSSCFNDACQVRGEWSVGWDGDRERCARAGGSYLRFEGQWQALSKCCNGDDTGCPAYTDTVVLENPQCPYDDGELVSRRQYYQKRYPIDEREKVPSGAPIASYVHCGDE